MKIRPSELLFTISVGIVLCSGCSVKEDRESCPCRLVLDFSEVDTSVVRSADLIVTADDGLVFTDELNAGDFLTEMHVSVPRGKIMTGVWSGTGGMLAHDGLNIPVGMDCPALYFHTSSVDADCELVREKVVMRKNHCRVRISLNNLESSPKGIGIFGNVNGFHADGTPSEGEFSCMAPVGGSGGEIILPRQTDNSLRMEVNDGTGIVKHFALGEYIAETGYDWNAPDLEDISLEIDVAFAKISLVIQGWDEVYRFEVVI